MISISIMEIIFLPMNSHNWCMEDCQIHFQSPHGMLSVSGEPEHLFLDQHMLFLRDELIYVHLELNFQLRYRLIVGYHPRKKERKSNSILN